jgi:Raf kinase inhibitor-like YbhB/YbcL family protein
MKLISANFTDGEEIPIEFTCQGKGLRPNLSWSEVLADAKTLAISMVDPDAPGGDFIHFIAINIPHSLNGLNSSEVIGEEITNSSGKTGYVAPCPPSGKHRYIFTLYALNVDRVSASTIQGFFDAAGPHIIDQASLTGVYGKI